MLGEDSISNMEESANGSVDLEIDRLRRRLQNLERSKAQESSLSASTGSIGQKSGDSSIKTGSSTRRRRSRRSSRKTASFDTAAPFAHLSRSSRNLGARQPSNDSLMHRSRSMSIGSTGGSVGGIFGDSDDDYSSSDDDNDVERRIMMTRQPSQYEAVNKSFHGGLDNAEERFARLKESDDLLARRGSDDDMGPISSTDDELSMPSRGGGGPRRDLLKNRRQESYRNIRTISMQPHVAGGNMTDDDEGDEFEVADDEIELKGGTSSGSGDSEVYTDIQAVARVQRYLNAESSASDNSDDNIAVSSVQPLHERIAEDDVSYTGSIEGSFTEQQRVAASPSGSRKSRNNTTKVSLMPGRRSSYGAVMPLSIGPGGKASIMESTHHKIDYYSSEDSDQSDGFGASSATAFDFSALQCAPSFSQFAMLQIQPEQLLLVENEYLFCDHGPAHLDAFTLNQELEFGDHFTANASHPIDPASVGSFCFPDGLRVRYLPRAGLIGARRMGWLGPKGDQSHIMVFTSGNGITDHGVAITIQWEMHLKKGEKRVLSEAVYKRRKRRRASRQIQNWWRRQVQDRILKEALKISGFPRHSPADLKAELNAGEIKLLEKALKSTSDRQLINNSRTKSSAGNAARRQLKKRGINKKLNNVLSRSHRSMSPARQNNNPVSVDMSAIEEVTRAAVLRSPSAALLGADTDSRDTYSVISDGTISEDEEAPGKLPLPKNASNRTSGRFSMRSFYSNRSTASMTSSPQPRPKRVLTRRPSKRVIDLAQESYEAMKQNDRLGSVCVVEKCYTLIGCQPDEHSLLLGPLQQLIDSERNEILALRRVRGDMTVKKRPKEKATTDVEEERRLEWELKNRRHIIIRAMREKLRLTTRQALVTYPRSQLEHIRGKVQYFETLVPQIPDSDTVKLPLPLPRIGKEWALAQFLLDIGPDSLVICLKLMLLERSILVLGDSLQNVTSTACALIELIKPFEWSSAFMPVLPRRMLDFVNCPVPFVAGVATRNVSEVENDSRVLEAMASGMSVLNLKTNTLQITTERGMSRMISLDPYLRNQLKSLRSRLQYMVREDPQSPLCNFNNFVRFGLSRRESITLRSVWQVLENHFTHFCGDLAVNDKAWKRYGTIDVETEEFVFNPEWFLNPIRADRAFHEQMVQTQLFNGYVHERREDQIEMQEIMEGDLGYLIAEWLYDKWKSKPRANHPAIRRW